MKTLRLFFCVFLFLWVLAACSSSKPSPTLEVKPSQTPNTETTTPQPTIIEPAKVVWANGLAPVLLNNSSYASVWLWSPTQNKLLYLNCQSVDGKIELLNAPSFSSQLLTKVEHCNDFPGSSPEAIWTLNGEQIVYFYATDKDQGLVSTWTMDRDGKNQHKLKMQTTFADHHFVAWLDENSLLTSTFSTGKYANYSSLNIKTGKEMGLAMSYWDTYAPYHGYVPVGGVEQPGEIPLGVISTKLPFASDPQHFNESGGQYRPVPEFNSIKWSEVGKTFVGWKPNTDEMLLTWANYKPDDWTLQKQHLLLWDVEKNKLSLLAPNAYDGGFSADAAFFADSTIGQAKVENGKFVDYENDFHPKLKDKLNYLVKSPPSHVQLLDLKQNKVILSIPGEYRGFSTTGAYLIFSTDGEIQTDETGWPIDIYQITKGKPYYYVIDLQTKKIAPALENISILWGWNPDGSKFIYQDNTGNLYLYDAFKATSIALTQTLNKKAFSAEKVNWSFDGQYFNIQMRNLKDNSFLTAIFKIP